MPPVQHINVNNTFQFNAPQGSVNALGNLSIENPTVEQLNAAIASSQVQPIDEDESDEPLFGVHIREAIGAVRRVLR